MSTDYHVTKHLIEILEDGKDGFAHGAEKLAEHDRLDLAATFREFSAQRAEFSDELERLASVYGDDIDEHGSILGDVHRLWMSLRDAIAGSDPDGVLSVAEQGEDHAVNEYRNALSRNISANLRSTIERQLAEIESARDAVKAMAGG